MTILSNEGLRPADYGIASILIPYRMAGKGYGKPNPCYRLVEPKWALSVPRGQSACLSGQFNRTRRW